MTILLGIDPGTHNTGFGLIEKTDDITCLDFGVISANPDWSFEQRLLFMGDEISRIMDRFQPQVCVTEDIFTAKNVKSSLMLAHVRGITVYMAKKHGCDLQHYAAKSVKKGVTGSGNATKEQVALLMQNLLHTQIHVNKLDATDALALAYYHASKMDMMQRFGASL